MADDKRIRELQTDTALPLNWRLPFDFTGLVAAQYRTLQQVIDVMNANRDLQQTLSGSANPDNALGNNGDTYYKFDAGTEFAVYFKTNDVWGLLFTIDLAGRIYFTDNSRTGIVCDKTVGTVTLADIATDFPTISTNGIIRASIDVLISGTWYSNDVQPECTKDGSGNLLTALFTLGNTGITTIRGRIF